MTKLDLTVGVAALAAVLLLPDVAFAGLGVVVVDPESGEISCRPLETCGDRSCPDGVFSTCDDSSDSDTAFCTRSGGLSAEVLCCTGTESECCNVDEGACNVAAGGCRLGFGDFASPTGEPAYVCKGTDRCPPDGMPVETLRRCLSFESGEIIESTNLTGGDCDRDGVPNGSDCCACGCPCAATSCDVELGGCPPDAGVAEDGGTVGADGGQAEDAGSGGEDNDAGATNQDAGGFDAGTPPDDETGGAGFEGDGGCRVSSGARSAPLPGALLVLAALARGRRSI